MQLGKDANLVYKAFSRVNTGLNKIKVFHTDRGNEFKNKLIDNLLDTFNIERSLSAKGSPYDNAVAEATFKSSKQNLLSIESLDLLKDLKRII